MQQAILITAYTNIDHLKRLLVSLNQGNFLFFIHLDKKSKIDRESIEHLSSFDNVKIISQEYSIHWGGFNHLQAILLLLKEALKYKDVAYFHVITGHDYPIKSNDEILAFLEQNKGKEFMEYNKLPYSNWKKGGYNRILHYNFYDILDGRKGWKRDLIVGLRNIQEKLGIKRRFPSDFPKDLYGGSTYWTLSRDSIEYIFDYMDQHPSYLKRFKHTFCSEEIFFQTLILNSPFKDNVVNDTLRFIVWENRNGNYPANLDETDYDAIKESNALFARKFEFPVSQALLKKIQLNITKESLKD